MKRNTTIRLYVRSVRFFVAVLFLGSFMAFATPWTNCFRVVEYSDLRHLQCTVADLECIDFCLDRWETNRWEVIDHSSGGMVHTASVLEGDWLSRVRYQSGYTTIRGQTQPFRFAFKWDGTNIGIRWVYHGWISVANVDGQLVILGCAMDQVENDLRVGDGERPIPGGGQEEPEIPDEELTFRWDYCQDRRGVRLVNPCVPNDTAGRIVIPATISGLPVVEISSVAFERCTNITEVVIPSTVTNIQDGAFYRCESLHTVELPDSLDAIEGYAFERCEALARVEVPIRANVRRNAFSENCEVVRTYPWDNAYKKMSQPAVTPVATEDDDWRVVDHGGSLELQGLSDQIAGVVAIPESLGGKPVTAIGEEAFYANGQISGLIIPPSISNIGYKAIIGCQNLLCLTIPCSVTNIEYGGVSHNENLGDLVIEANLRKIEEWTFNDQRSLTNLVLKGTIGTICGWSFVDCENLKQVLIYPGVGKIESGAFIGMPSLKSVVVPCTTIVEEGAFPNGCEIVRVGPQARFYDNTDAFGYEECWLPALLGTNAWNGVGTIRAMVEGGTGSGDDEDLVRICNVLGVGPARTVRQRNGTLDAYFAMPTIRMESFDVRTWTMVARVVPPEGARIVHAPDIAPVDSDDAISIDAAYELKDFSGGRSCFYVPGKDDITVTAEDYLNDGRIVFTFDDYFVGKDYHFYRLHVRPKKWWSRR